MAGRRPRPIFTNNQMNYVGPEGDLKYDINAASFDNISLTQAIDLENLPMYQSCRAPSKSQSTLPKPSQQFSQPQCAFSLKDKRPIVPAAPRPRSHLNGVNRSHDPFDRPPTYFGSGNKSSFVDDDVNKIDPFKVKLPAQQHRQYHYEQERQSSIYGSSKLFSETNRYTNNDSSYDFHDKKALENEKQTLMSNFGLKAEKYATNNEIQNGNTFFERKENISSNKTKPLFRATSSNFKEKQDNPTVSGVQLRSIDEIPRQFQHIFKFPYFNVLQSLLLDEVLYTDKSVVASAPTGSGKTVIFELALVRLLTKPEFPEIKRKIVYMAPMKALCSERYLDWTEKFGNLGINCLEITGDSELEDFTEVVNANLICTTPEKWDSMSRRWKDNKILFQQIQLFLIDEIHILNDHQRGATVEAVVSRMKTLEKAQELDNAAHIRFVAVSATMPNYKDIAEWLGTPSKPASAFNLGEEFRPVKLEKIVLGYPFKTGTSDFRFDMNLSYRLKSIIETHSHGKPSLVFCSTRKSVVQSAEALAGDLRTNSLLAHFSAETLHAAAKSVHEHKLSELLHRGIGIHHAGLDTQDRHTVEELFKASQLPVLISTSTLAMGVNLPAHLVVIKSTHFYNMGMVQEYSNMQVLQMIGRAGRPQFDTSATAVIMTKAELKAKYSTLVNGTQLIESSLHKNLIEHLNAEIVLQTISDMNLVVEWIRHTFLYVRVLKNPCFYGLSSNLSTQEVEKKLQDLCLQNVTHLTSESLVSINDEHGTIWPTENGKLMARYCIAFETMKHFGCIDKSQENISEMIKTIAHCAEFDDVQLRINEKKILNSLNRDKNHETIRFPLQGKIKSKQMKVNCLIQAQLSCLPVHDFSLSQDMAKIFRVGQRVAKCLMEFMYQGNSYSVLLHAILVYKAFKSKLWFDSRYVARQLDGIGPTMSLALANSGLSSFHKLDEAHPRDIEVIVNRHPPFGNQVKEALTKLPRYELSVEQMKCYKPHKCVLVLSVDLLNRSAFETVTSSQITYQSILIIGDADNNNVFKWRIFDATIVRDGMLTRNVEVNRATEGTKLSISLLNLNTVGLDIQTEYEPVYQEGWFPTCKRFDAAKDQTPASKLKKAMDKAKADPRASSMLSKTSCNHKCLNKSTCGHKCCKSNDVRKRPAPQVSGSGKSEPDCKSSKVEQPGYIASKEVKDILGIFQGQQSGPRLKMSKQLSSSGVLPQHNKSIDKDTPSDLQHSEQGHEHLEEFENDDMSDVIIIDEEMLKNIESPLYVSEDSSQAQTDRNISRGFKTDRVATNKHGNNSIPEIDPIDMQYWENHPHAKISPEIEKFSLKRMQAEKHGPHNSLGDEKTLGNRSKPFDSFKRQEQIGSFAIADEKTYLKQQSDEKDIWEQEDQCCKRHDSEKDDGKEAEACNNPNLAVRGWDDLDMFHQSRQNLFRKGRPIHLRDDEFEDDLPSLTNSPDLSASHQGQKQQSGMQDSLLCGTDAAGGQWTTTTSSDEELCHLADGVTCPSIGPSHYHFNSKATRDMVGYYDYTSCSRSPSYGGDISQVNYTSKPKNRTPLSKDQGQNLTYDGLTQNFKTHEEETNVIFAEEDCMPLPRGGHNMQYYCEPGFKNLPNDILNKNSWKQINISKMVNKSPEDSIQDIVAPTVVSLTDSGPSHYLSLSVESRHLLDEPRENDEDEETLKQANSATRSNANIAPTLNNTHVTQSGQNCDKYNGNYHGGFNFHSKVSDNESKSNSWSKPESCCREDNQNRTTKSPHSSHRYGHVLAWNKTNGPPGQQPGSNDSRREEKGQRNPEFNFFSSVNSEEASAVSTSLFDGIF